MKKIYILSVLLVSTFIVAQQRSECEKIAEKNHRARVKQCHALPQSERGKCQSASAMTFKAEVKACRSAR